MKCWLVKHGLIFKLHELLKVYVLDKDFFYFAK